MNDTKKCPACGMFISNKADICPNCNLGNLNQIFLNKEDYEEWVKNYLKPHMERLSSRVFAGWSHGLILSATGELYGMGNNDSGQLGYDAPREVDKPHPIAKNVKSAAAGYSYSIYVTNDGEVNVLGVGEYCERFKGFKNAERVFALYDADVFWIKDETGQLYVFGDNTQELISPISSSDIYEFMNMSIDVQYTCEEKTILAGTHGSSTYYIHDDNYSELKQKMENELKKSQIYQNFAQQCGESNLDIRLTSLKTELLSGTYGSNSRRKERQLYKPHLVYKNERIYAPVKSSYSYEECPYYAGSGLIRMEESRKIPKMDGIKKAVRFTCTNPRGDYWLILKDNAELGILDSVENDRSMKIFLNQVFDVSATQNFIMISKKSGGILIGDPQILLGKKPWSEFKEFTI